MSDKKKAFTFTLKPELIEKLRPLAKDDGRSLSNYIDRVIETHLSSQS